MVNYWRELEVLFLKSTGKLHTARAAAFPHTVPIVAGFLFLGIAYGVYMRTAGFSAIYPIVMSMTIFAGSMEFVTVNLLLGAFDPLGAFGLTLMVSAGDTAESGEPQHPDGELPH